MPQAPSTRIRHRLSARARWLALALIALTIAACSPQEPVRIGFIGTISGRGADLGISGRNGAELAIEMRNAAGGVDGRQIEFITRDDGNDPEHARRAFRELVREGADVVIGPMTSSMAMALLPEANSAGVVLISPTATSNALSGKDDHFFRVVAPTEAFASRSAENLYRLRNVKTLAVIYDARNAAYAGSWLADFRTTFEGLGGRILSVLTFESGPDERFVPLATSLLGEKADGVLMLANSLDAALIAQQLRKLDEKVVLAASEWAATERLTEIGGGAVEGISIASFLDENNSEPAFLAFSREYAQRYGNRPSFGALTGFDAANAALDALASRDGKTPLREQLKAHPGVDAAQGRFNFDAFGDGQRETYVMTVENGRFKRLPNP